MLPLQTCNAPAIIDRHGAPYDTRRITHLSLPSTGGHKNIVVFYKGTIRDRSHRVFVPIEARWLHCFEGTIEDSQMTLYMKLGGRKAIMRAMPHLLARLEQDACFTPGSFRQEFERSDDLSEFLIFLSGGAPFYDGKPICELLSPICTCADVYERFVDHLVCVLFGGKPAAGDEAHLRKLMDRLQPHVLDPKPVAPVKVYSVEPEMPRA